MSKRYLWLRPELFVGLALLSWTGTKIVAGFVARINSNGEYDAEQPLPFLAMGVFGLVALGMMLFAGGRPDGHVARAAALLWTQFLGLGILFSVSGWSSEGAQAWMSTAMLGAVGSMALAALLAQRRDDAQRERIVLAVGLMLLGSIAGHCAYRPHGDAGIGEALVAIEYRGLGLLLAFELALAFIVLIVEARQLVVARTLAILCLGQIVLLVLGELAGARGMSAAAGIVIAANLGGELSVVAGLALFVAAVCVAWFSRERLPPASVAFLIGLVPLFAFSRGPDAPERSLDRMLFQADNLATVPNHPDAPLIWPVDELGPTGWWVEESVQRATTPVYVDGSGSVYLAEPLEPLDILYVPPGAAWVSGDTRVEALRPLIDFDECGAFVDAYWLSSPLAELDPASLRRLPSLALRANRPASRRIYFHHRCDWQETYEIDAEVAPPLRLLLRRQPELNLVVHGAPNTDARSLHAPYSIDPIEVRRPRPNPLALRESPWSIALGFLMGFAIAFVRVRRSRPVLGEPAPVSARLDRRWPPWLLPEEVNEKHYEAAREGSPYRGQAPVIGTSSTRSSRPLFMRRLGQGLGKLIEALFLAAVVATVLGAILGGYSG